MNADGTQDNTFRTDLGGPDVIPGAFMTIANYPDDKILVGGYFKIWNGENRGYINRLNSDGTNDPTFLISPGFNNYVEKVLIEPDTDTILVAGRFTDFDGTGVNGIVRLNDNGTYNTTFGSGFNNTVNDLVKTPDGAIYTSGYYDTFDGATSLYVSRLTPGGTADSGFSTGTSFAPTGITGIPGAGPIGVLAAQDNGVYCFGYNFTSYNGTSANKVVKLLSNGTIDTTFEYGTGFDAAVGFMEFTKSGKIFCGGDFTTYNGISSLGAIILNVDGSICQTFEQSGYANHYTVDDEVYAIDTTTGELVRLTSAPALELSITNILFNAGGKYFPLDIFSNSSWNLELIDIGDGTTWLEAGALSGDSSTEIPLKISYNSTSASRRMQIKVSNGVYNKWVTINQNGI
jgi:uncharacterized delta-60 repeat protein